MRKEKANAKTALLFSFTIGKKDNAKQNNVHYYSVHLIPTRSKQGHSLQIVKISGVT